jgi:MgtE intracellular N domain
MAGERAALREWHRLFGLLLTDFFTGSPFTVELERDLSKQQQLLDVIILRHTRGRFAGRLPDGLTDLTAHNLLTFKSHHETLDDWAMKELVGHYVAYRKLVSPSPSALLAEDNFRLYAVCARFPQNLAGQVPWQERQEGVYDCRWGTDTVRIVVAGQLPREPQNAPLHLFSASAELVSYGQNSYQQRSTNTSALLGELFTGLRKEGLVMPYTMADFQRDYARKYFPKLPPEDRRDLLQSLPPEDRRDLLQSLPPEDRRDLLQSLPPEDRRDLLQSLPAEERQGILESLPPEERLAGLSEEQIRQYLERLTTRRQARPRKRKKN